MKTNNYSNKNQEIINSVIKELAYALVETIYNKNYYIDYPSEEEAIKNMSLSWPSGSPSKRSRDGVWNYDNSFYFNQNLRIDQSGSSYSLGSFKVHSTMTLICDQLNENGVMEKTEFRINEQMLNKVNFNENS